MNLKKIIKRVVVSIVVIVVLLVATAIAIPYFFKDEIIAKIKEEANNSINATLEFGDVNLSLLKNFPNFSFEMSDLSLVGIDQFEGVPLVAAKNIDFTLDLMSVIKSDRPIEVEKVNLDQPEVNILILKDGTANYDIAKSSETSSDGSSAESAEYDFLVQLKKYKITEGNITYDDRASNLFFEMKNLSHEGRGDFTQDVFDLVTETSVEHLTAVSGGIPYLKKANTKLDATFKIDMPNSKYSLIENDLQINAMKLLADGFVQLKDDDINIDFTFDAPSNDFKSLLSLIPNAYTADFSEVKADGKMAFKGYVKGTYNGVKEQLPAFKINLNIDNGNFKYPSLAMGLNNIFTNLEIESPSSNLDKMKIDIPNFKFALDGEPFEGRFKLTTPISDPNVDTKIKGKIDLSDINKAFPMEGVSEFAGIINADLEAKARLSTIENGNYESVNMNGNASIKNLTYAAAGLPKVFIQAASLDFSPKYADVKNFKGKFGKSDIEASGKIDNILAYFSPEKTMTGDMKLRSKYFNLDEWMGETETDEIAPSAEVAATSEVEIFDQFKFRFDAKIGKIDYDVYQLINTSYLGSFSPNELTIKDLRTNIGDSDLKGKGSITNVFNYVFKNETLRGDIAIESNYFNLNPFMEETETAKPKNISNTNTEEYEPIIIPDNYDLNIKAKIKKLIYTDLELKDFSGNLKVKDSKVKMDNVSTRTLGGKIEADGFYDTQDPNNPKYELTYDIKNFGFQNSFQKFITIQTLAPIADYIEGNYSSRLKINGILGKDMVPEFTSLDADGFLQTANGFIKDFEPINKIGEALNIKKLKDHKINLKGTKNWFEVQDGKVTVKEFPLKYQGIDMKIGGSHGITQDIDYDIKAKIPIKMIDKNPVGSAAKKGLDLLNSQASKLNIKLDAGEFVNVNIKLTGSLKDPKVSFSLVGSEGQTVKEVITKTIEAVKDTVVAEVKEVIDDKKEQLEAKVQAKKRALSKEADDKIRIAKAAAEKSANRIRKEGVNAARKVKEEGYKQADLLVSKAGNNPLKKRAAKIAADKLKKKADESSRKVEAKANAEADQLIKRSDDEAKKIRAEYQKKIDKITVDNIGK